MAGRTKARIPAATGIMLIAALAFHLAGVTQTKGTLLFVSAIMAGANNIAALVLGADCTLIGRDYLYGFMAGRRVGVDRTVAELAPEHVRILQG